MGRISNGRAVFRNRIYFRTEINRTPDNRKIDHVDFFVFDESGDEVYRRTERVYGYCAFGGGEPDCTVLEIKPGAHWPDTDRLIRNGDYNVEADIYLQGDDVASATWQAPFTIQNPDLGEGGSVAVEQSLVTRIVQTAPGTDSDVVYDALVFQVEAYDPNRGNRDGDGIRNVDLEIFDANGNRVYTRTENNAAYCAFAGGEPDCNVWNFAEYSDAWPSGEPIYFGAQYTLRGVAHADSGQSQTVEMTITIE